MSGGEVAGDHPHHAAGRPELREGREHQAERRHPEEQPGVGDTEPACDHDREGEAEPCRGNTPGEVDDASASQTDELAVLAL